MMHPAYDQLNNQEIVYDSEEADICHLSCLPPEREHQLPDDETWEECDSYYCIYCNLDMHLRWGESKPPPDLFLEHYL